MPAGFRVASVGTTFVPEEVPGDKQLPMQLTLLALDQPTDSWSAVFTQNAFPGHPVRIGRRRVAEGGDLAAILVNNKISNVGCPGGEAASEELCESLAAALGVEASQVMPSSTGIIGWKLPVPAMQAALPSLCEALSDESLYPAARGIMTTDLYPKARRASVSGTDATVVGIAKGAGMVEPNMATMLSFILTDADISRPALAEILRRAVGDSFNALSIDSDTSTSDTVVIVSSRKRQVSAAGPDSDETVMAVEAAVRQVCEQLAMDVVRNGEGVQHVVRVRLTGARTRAEARLVGKSIANSPLWKTAVAGNDPNCGRLIAAVGKALMSPVPPPSGDAVETATPAERAAGVSWPDARISIGGIPVFDRGQFMLDPEVERGVATHMRGASLWESTPEMLQPGFQVEEGADAAWFTKASDLAYHSPVEYPPHQRCVEVEVDLGVGCASDTVLGNDLTHEYVAINADYRS